MKLGGEKVFKDGASLLCYCAYVLRIWRYAGFRRVVPTNTGIFKLIYFRDNKASFCKKKKKKERKKKKKKPYIALYFTAFQNNCCLITSKICVATPNFLFGFQ